MEMLLTLREKYIQKINKKGINMDTSEQYIKMCESAKEIQKLWQPDIGNWFLNDYRGTTEFTKDVEKQIWGDDKDKWEKIQCLTYKPSIKEYVTISDSDGAHTYKMDEFFKHRHIWLPRQDQLQEMLKGSHTIVAIIQGLHWFCDPDHFCPDNDNEHKNCKCYEIGIERRKMFKTIEQFTLAFVMDELYKKKWNGSEWIKRD